MNFVGVGVGVCVGVVCWCRLLVSVLGSVCVSSKKCRARGKYRSRGIIIDARISIEISKKTPGPHEHIQTTKEQDTIQS